MQSSDSRGAWLDAPPTYRVTRGCSRRRYTVAVRGRRKPTSPRKEHVAPCDHAADASRRAGSVERGTWALVGLCALGWLVVTLLY